tara:strand:+ start:1774 stop:3921 length:2148 start_codon:yes stop_codon:yes gene_type:complete
VPSLEEVLGSGPQATPTFHDFMEGKNLRYITDDGELENIIETLRTLTSSSTKAEPQLISVDVETTAVQSLLTSYEEKFKEHEAARVAFTAFPTPAKCTPEERIDREKSKRTLDGLRVELNAVAKQVKKSGLNVYVGQVRLLQLYWGNNDVIVIDRWKVSPKLLDTLGSDILNKDNVVWLAHNAQFDVKMLTQMGITPARHPHCTLLQAQALESITQIRKDLASRCLLILNKEPNKAQQASDWGRDPLDQSQLYYAAGDVVATWELHHVQYGKVCSIKRTPQEDCKWVYDLMRSGIRAVNEVMVTGLSFDAESHKDLASLLEAKYEQGRVDTLQAFSEHSADGAPTIENPASVLQVAKWLRWHLETFPPYNTDGWPKTDTGQLRVGKEQILEHIKMLPPANRKPMLALANWADAKKNSSTLGTDFKRFINPISNRIHANFRIGGTETGRFSVTEPALQTINATKEFRHLFVSKPNHSLVVYDYGQIEVRVAAAMANDKVLLDAIEQGLDVHTMTARHCFRGEFPEDVGDEYFGDEGKGKVFRSAAKACIFGLIYGQGPRGLAQRLTSSGHQTTPNEAGRIQHDVLDLYTGLKRWINQTRKQADDSGFLWTSQGRVYAPYSSSQLYTKSVNTPCQGGAAEIMLLCLSRFPKAWGNLKAKLVHVVHDELIAEVPDIEVEDAKTIMASTMQWAATEFYPNIPQFKLVEGGVGKTWGSAK